MRIIVFIVLVLFVPVVGLADTIRMYNIGNSLTDDARPKVQRDILARSGHTLELGYHITSGKNLAYIAANPGETATETGNLASPAPYGKWLNALTNYEWDVITLQTYKDGTGNAEVQATSEIIEAALSGGRNQDCVFYLYLAWPGQSTQMTFADQLEQPYTDGNMATVISESFLDFWFNEVSVLYPELDIRVVPTGTVLARLDVKLREIHVGPYADAYDLYRDSLHMSNTDGRYVSLVTMLSAVTRIPPEEHIYSDSHLASLNTEFRILVDEVVWSVLTADRRTHIEYTPFLNLVQREASPYYEFTYLGELYQSTDLNQWEKVTGAASPQRIINAPGHVFYRSVKGE